jgi:hypothetical protein
MLLQELQASLMRIRPGISVLAAPAAVGEGGTAARNVQRSRDICATRSLARPLPAVAPLETGKSLAKEHRARHAPGRAAPE